MRLVSSDSRSAFLSLPDDVRRNFLMNPQNGLKIKPYREALKNYDKDRELYYLTKYLRLIAEREDDFTVLNHKHWQRYVNNSRSKLDD